MTPSVDDHSARRNVDPWTLALFAFAGCTVAMILSLPLFPSQDGPVHLYYVDVLRGLLTHTGPYPQYFEIKSYLTPYVLQYYFLLGLEYVFPPLLSEKLLICIYVLLFISGFRYLLRSLTATPGVWALVGALFCLNLYTFMGFQSYALGSSFVLFFAGFWLRWMKKLTAKRIVQLMGGYLLLALTHPLPPAVFVAFAGLYLVVSIFHDAIGIPGGLKMVMPKYRRPIAVVVSMGLFSCLWILRFAGATRTASLPDHESLNFSLRFISQIVFRNLEPMDLGIAYRFVLMPMVAIAVIAILISLSEKRKRTAATITSVITFAAILFFVSCLTPSSLNGTGYFSERFSIYWVMFLIAAAAAIGAPRWCNVAVGVIVIPAAVSLLYCQWHYLSSTARNLNDAINLPLVKPGALGAIISDGESPGIDTIHPYMWGGVHYFRQSQAILTNAPWLDLKFIMLRPRQFESWTYENFPEVAPMEILNTLNKKGTVPLDFLVGYGQYGSNSQQLIRRLGFQPLRPDSFVAIYRRPDL